MSTCFWQVLRSQKTVSASRADFATNVRGAVPGGIHTHAWGLMSTVMTEVLSKADWLKLWDHVLSNSPPFFMFLLLSYLVFFRAQIMSAETREHLEGITRRCNSLDLNKVLLSPQQLCQFCC